MQKKLYSLLVLLLASFYALAQQGAIKGTVKDATTGEPVPFASIVLELNGNQVASGQTDFDGVYQIKPVVPGTYNVKAVLLGYKPKQINGVVIGADVLTFNNFVMTSTTVEIKEVEIVSYTKPLFEIGSTSNQQTLTREEISQVPTREVASIASQTAGVSQKDDGKELNVKGGRSDQTYYYIDGIKVRGIGGRAPGVSRGGIEQITVLTGGVPAQYGDATSGVISITTRGPSRDFTAGITYETSQFLDAYGNNLVELNLGGPLVTKKEGDQKKPLIGYWLTGQFSNVKDPSPSAIGAFKLKDDVYNNIVENPLVYVPGSAPLYRANYVTANDLEKIKARENAGHTDILLNGKLDFKTSANTNVTIGGNFEYAKFKNYQVNRSLFATESQGEQTNNTYRVFGRFTQHFGNSGTDKNGEAKKTASALSNAYYTLQVDYSKNSSVLEDAQHRDNFWQYGHIANFKQYRKRNYADVDARLLNGQEIVNDGMDSIVQTSWEDSALVMGGKLGYNQEMYNYNQQVYNFYALDGRSVTSLGDLRTYKGLANGEGPPSVYGLFLNSGTIFDAYQRTNNNQLRLQAQGAFDIKDHAFSFGVEYEQRIDRGYTIQSNSGNGPSGFWTLGRQYVNQHLIKDTLGYSFTETRPDGSTLWVQRFDYMSNKTGPNNFARNLRSKLGLKNSDWIDMDNLDPSQLSIDMFSADELYQSGNGALGNYYGYDYKGNKSNAKMSIENFLRDTLNRPIGAFEPNYIAGFIQDKFAFKDLIFNVGVRVDRYDANQPVLKDMYLLDEARTLGDPAVQKFMADKGFVRPGNADDDWVVYLDAQEGNGNPGKIVGYRKDNVFYDVQGARLKDASALTLNSPTVVPYLVDVSNKNTLNPVAFQAYEAKVNVMPRVSFSFPISDVAQFFAHYDVLTQRPNAGNRFNPLIYQNFSTFAGGNIANPDLKPERTTDYEIGFKQKVSRTSALTISAYYREMRNMIGLQLLQFAYPSQYTTFTNRDFGNTKGLTIAYDLRRTNNVAIRASYTLQFAEGTGSTSTSGQFRSATDPEVRVLLPLDFDQRHQIITSFDYRYDGGSDYNGPMLFGKRIFENAGANFVFRLASGTPYSRYEFALDEGSGSPDRRFAAVTGQVNGSRMPWQFKVDMKIDKTFNVKVGKRTGADGERRSLEVNAYLQIQNLFDTKNVINVYRYTGLPDDDGYLTSSRGVTNIARQVNPQSYADLYTVRLLNPANYSLPRRIRLGVSVAF